jgi:hypothetical protein
MRVWLPILTLVTAGAVGSLSTASARWRRTSDEEARPLEPRSLRLLVSEDDFHGLPDVVEKYLRRALPQSSVPSSVRIEHEGEFLLNTSWRPFQSTEVFSVEPRGFLWDARIRAVPFLDVLVRDSAIAGTGSMHASVAGVFPVTSQRGEAPLNVGALQRYLAEAPWLPAALLPRFGVRWSEIDNRTARAALTETDTTVSLDFTFDGSGDVTRVYSPARPREIRGVYQPTPWAARLSNYQERCGMRVPLDSEVEWIVDGTPRPYFRGRIVEIRAASESRGGQP